VAERGKMPSDSVSFFRFRFRFSILIAAAAAAAAAVIVSSWSMGQARAERAVLLDRIVAVVEDKTILRSDVIARSRPYLARVDPKEDTPEHTRKVHREILEKIIDEQLIAAEAQHMHISAGDEEIDRAIVEVAKLNKLDRAQLIVELKKQGMTFDEYRDEIRRQVLDGKWTNIKVRSQIREPQVGTDEEKKQAVSALVAVERKKVLARLRAQSHVEIRW
jgi:peptidyl-prolyl cis-trans isomerase SurA